jgi:rubrerythrin
MNVDDRPIGLSVWEQELYERLTEHIASESEVLERYEGLAEESSGHVRFLLALIAEDEARHHRLYEQWARTVREMVLVTEPGDAVPDLTPETDPDRLIAAVDDLLAVEKDDAHQLKALDKSLKDVRPPLCGPCSSSSWRWTRASTSRSSSSCATRSPARGRWPARVAPERRT